MKDLVVPTIGEGRHRSAPLLSCVHGRSLECSLEARMEDLVVPTLGEGRHGSAPLPRFVQGTMLM